MQHIKWAKSSKIQSLCNIKRNFVNFSCTLFKKLQKLVKLEKNFVQFRKSGGKFSSTFYFVRIITVMTKYVQNRSEKEIISWHINYSLYFKTLFTLDLLYIQKTVTESKRARWVLLYIQKTFVTESKRARWLLYKKPSTRARPLYKMTFYFYFYFYFTNIIKHYEYFYNLTRLCFYTSSSFTKHEL